ncbi:type II toxin-antitoxin system HicA family toxin [Candidatus Poribacteria bacterium]|nr:type II toxin-antitoxin system HicA family toxin [Candidatus Poribacteria bacterium]
MAIDYSQLRGLTARRLIRAFRQDGFYLEQQRGTAHRQYRHPDGRRVTVSFHRSSGTFKPGTLQSIIEEQARWTEDDLKRLGLLK